MGSKEDIVWIFDSYSKGCVELWGRERNLTKVSAANPPSFYTHLDDPTGHMKMVEGPESRYKVEECGFRTIYGTFQGYRVFANRKVVNGGLKVSNSGGIILFTCQSLRSKHRIV